MKPGISDVPALPSKDQERVERAREEFKKLTEYIGREARAEKPPRHLRFQEAEFGSRKFFNVRYFDKETKAAVSEEIHLDPSLLLEGPPGAFYAVLWHEFGHGEPEYREVELAYDKDYEKFSQEDKAASDYLLNIKLDLMIDAANLEKRPGLANAYRALYDDFFPEAGMEQPSRLRELAEKHGMSASAQELGKRLEGPLRAADYYLISLKHESYWHREHEAMGVPKEERAANPYGRLDADIAHAIVGTRVALLASSDPRLPIGRRSKVFDEKIASTYFRMKEEKRGRLIGRLKEWSSKDEDVLVDVWMLTTALIDERTGDEWRAAYETVKAKEELVGKLRAKRDTSLESIEDIRLKLELRRREKNEADLAMDSYYQGLSKMADGIVSRLPLEEQDLLEQEQALARLKTALDGVRAYPKMTHDAEEAADNLLKELSRHAPEPPAGPPHASESTKEIDKSDEHHPDNPDFNQLFPQAKPGDKPGKPAKAPSKGEGQEAKAQTPKPKESRPTDVAEARRIRNLIDAPALEKLATGLTLSFIEDRESEILKDLPHGRLPQARKAEAVRRRYAGEREPQVREIQKRSESFMGVDIIVANDHSGSMMGPKEDAAKAANLALAEAAQRVNVEIGSRMRRLGLSDAELRAVSPVRYLGILFADATEKLNDEGWETPLERKGANDAERQQAREKFGAEMFGGYVSLPMGGTNDRDAAALALYEAYGAPHAAFSKPEERVKLLIFVTDGAGDIRAMSALMKYLHGKSEEFPPSVLEAIEAIEPGAGERVLAALKKYRDQVFAVGVGIYDYDGERQTLMRVYNEGANPEAGTRPAEEENVLLLPASQVRELPARMLKLVNSKFQSRKFRAVRERFKERGRRARRNKG